VNVCLQRRALLVFAVALAVRMLYLAQIADHPTFATPIVDAATYHDLARDWAAGKPASEGFFWQPFFYPAALGLLYKLAGPSLLAARVAQLILGALTCVLTFHLGRRLAGERAGLVAGLLAACYAPMFIYEADLVGAGWEAFWAVSLLLLLTDAAERPGPAQAFALGVVAALAVLTRPTFIPFVAAVAVWLLLRWRRDGFRAAARLALLAAGFALPALPVAYLNQKVTGHFGILPCSGGLNLYIGNNPDTCHTLNIRPGADWDTLTSEPAREGILDTWAQDRYFRDLVRDYAREQPGRFASDLGRKALRFVSSRELPRNEDPYVLRGTSSLAAALMWKVDRFGFPFGLVFPLACIGLVAYARRWPAPVWLFLALYPAAVILVFVSARYRVPTLPLGLVLAAAGAVWLVETRRWRALAGGALAAALTLPGPWCEEGVTYEAELYNAVAGAKYRRGDRDGALADVRRALELDRDHVEALHTLGVIQAGREDPAAARTFEQVLRKRRDHPDALYHLGCLRLEQGRMNDAARLFEAALPLRPRNADLRLKYGIALAELKRTDEAASQFAVARALNPDLPDIHFNLGLALLELDRTREAVRHLKEELKREPDDAAAWIVLGQARAARGDRKLALECHRKALLLQPGWPEAREGYARALLAQQNETLDEDATNLLLWAADRADATGDAEAAALLRNR
jgi:tetratricopeptide (TPR) repeat protein/4-amino-4-deoxy-L-arabinose transferase-like glycosyltransferase